MFSEDFIPAVLEEVGCSATPWKNLDVDLLQGCTDLVYPGLDYTVEKGDALDLSVSQAPLPCPHPHIYLSQANARVMAFRNAIGTAAVTNVQAFMKRFKTPELTEQYVKFSLIYYGEIPFLYRVFESSNVRSAKEKGGYQVVCGSSPSEQTPRLSCCQTRHGLFQNQAILDTMLIYYGKRGLKEYLPTTSSPGTNPIGALALICTAVRTPNRRLSPNSNAVSLYRLNVRSSCTQPAISSRTNVPILKSSGVTEHQSTSSS